MRGQRPDPTIEIICYQGIGVSKGSSTFTSPPPSPDLRRFRGYKVERSAGLEGDLGTVAPTRRC